MIRISSAECSSVYEVRKGNTGGLIIGVLIKRNKKWIFEPYHQGYWKSFTSEDLKSLSKALDELNEEDAPQESPEDPLRVLVKELVEILNTVEESPNTGEPYHPTKIHTCRLQHTERLNELLRSIKKELER